MKNINFCINLVCNWLLTDSVYRTVHVYIINNLHVNQSVPLEVWSGFLCWFVAQTSASQPQLLRYSVIEEIKHMYTDMNTCNILVIIMQDNTAIKGHFDLIQYMNIIEVFYMVHV